MLEPGSPGKLLTKKKKKEKKEKDCCDEKERKQYVSLFFPDATKIMKKKVEKIIFFSRH